MIILGNEFCEEISHRLAIVMDHARTKGWMPERKKSMRTFGITEAARMCGRTTETIRNLEKEKKFPPPIIETSADGKTTRRAYTLENINAMRDYFHTRSKKTGKKPAVIAIANFKGGVSKSYTAIHLAQALALKGYRLLVADLDSQASATLLAGLIPSEEIHESDTLLPYFRRPLEGERTRLNFIQNVKSLIRKTYFSGIDLIPAGLALYNIELEIPVRNAQAHMQNRAFEFHEMLRDAIYGNETIQGIADDYDFIILDCPPSMSVANINAIYAANSLLVPIPPSYIDISSSKQFFEMLENVFKVYPNHKFNLVKIIITKHEQNATQEQQSHNHEIAKVLKHYLQDMALDATMPYSSAITKTSSVLKTIFDVTPKEFKEILYGSPKTLKNAIDSANDIAFEVEKFAKEYVWEKTT